MNANRVDAIARLFARRTSRRAAIAAGGTALAAAALAHVDLPARGQGATPDATAVSEAEFLFVQTFESGTWAPHPEADDAYVLTLTGHAAQTIYFSDRPERIVGVASTPQFFQGLGFGPDNPPNAALVLETSPGEADVVVLELTAPSYDESAGTVTYVATVLEDYQDLGITLQEGPRGVADVPASFGAASLFIDDCPDIVNCYVPDASISTGGPSFGARVVGPVPDGPIGTCWSWLNLACLPCNGERFYDIGQSCDQAYGACGGNCFVWAPGLSTG